LIASLRRASAPHPTCVSDFQRYDEPPFDYPNAETYYTNSNNGLTASRAFNFSTFIRTSTDGTSLAFSITTQKPVVAAIGNARRRHTFGEDPYRCYPTFDPCPTREHDLTSPSK
jgi:hypothetical protein